MNESDIIRLVRQVLREELAPILMGKVTSNQSQTRLNAQRFATEGEVQGLRSIQPFGVSSRAPAGTPNLVVPIDANATHLISVGNFDEAKPTGADGELILYDAYGHVIFLSSSKIQVGSKASAENMVLGQVFKSMMDTLLTAIANHTHIGNLGYETAPPTQKADFLAIKASPIDDKLILSDKVFTEK